MGAGVLHTVVTAPHRVFRICVLLTHLFYLNLFYRPMCYVFIRVSGCVEEYYFRRLMC